MAQQQNRNPAERRKIAFVQAAWHRDIVDESRLAFVAELEGAGYAAADIEVFEVPGVFEIPLHAKLLARSGRYAAVVAAGLVVDGGIYRHDFVSTAVVNGLMQVQLETEVPVISVVLTPHHFHGHREHQQFFHAHFGVKGIEAARACLDTIARLAAVRGLDAAPRPSLAAVQAG